jgi:hypothetical protein
MKKEVPADCLEPSVSPPELMTLYHNKTQMSTKSFAIDGGVIGYDIQQDTGIIDTKEKGEIINNR